MSDAEPGDHRPVEAADDLGVELTPEQEAAFRDYFVVQTPATARRFLSAVAPVVGHFDAESLERIGENWELDPSPESGPPYDKPTIIVTGRRDTAVGYRTQWRLMDHYRQSSFATLGPAGHAPPRATPGPRSTPCSVARRARSVDLIPDTSRPLREGAGGAPDTYASSMGNSSVRPRVVRTRTTGAEGLARANRHPMPPR